jgi:arsenate reductase
VAAIERAGFKVEDPGGDNPRYEVSFSEQSQPMICFSKKFDDDINPDNNFAAIMTCSDADENCPFVPGTEFRKPITYVDPKEADGTEREAEVYDERCRQIATEMFYMMNLVRSKN